MEDKKHQVGYKVTDSDNFSLLAEGASRVKYIIGEWVEAPTAFAEKGYHLTYFSELERAQKEGLGCPRKIWECEVDGVLSKLPPMVYSFDVENIPYGKGYTKNPNGWPSGTMMAKRIRLIKEVK